MSDPLEELRAELTDEGRGALARGCRIARATGSEEVMLEHVLLALLERRPRLSEALLESGFDEREIRRSLPTSRRFVEGDERPPTDGLRLSSETSRLLETIPAPVDERGLLAGLLEERLDVLPLEAEGLLASLDESAEDTAVPPPIPPPPRTDPPVRSVLVEDGTRVGAPKDAAPPHRDALLSEVARYGIGTWEEGVTLVEQGETSSVIVGGVTVLVAPVRLGPLLDAVTVPYVRIVLPPAR